MRTDRNIRLIEAHALFTNMLFVIPVLLPFYRDQMGLSFNDFLLGEACFAATLVLLDVPTGWISDQWKRKHVLALGSFMDAAGFCLMTFSHGLAMAITSQIIVGIGCSLISGTNTAMLYESLMANGREGEYRKRDGRRAAIYLYSAAGSSVLGGLLYPHHHALPVLLCVVVELIGVAIACLMDEPARHRKTPEKHPVADIIETTRYALSHPQIGFLIVFGAALGCSTKMIMWTQQPYYMALGLHESLYGILMAVGYLLGGTASQLAYLLDGKVSTFRVLAGAWGIAVLVCLGAASHVGFGGVGLLMIGGTCLWGITSPRVGGEINRHVDSSRRATILSTQSLLSSMLFIPLSRAMGYVSDAYGGVQAVLLMLAVWLGFAGLCLVLWGVQRQRVALA